MVRRTDLADFDRLPVPNRETNIGHSTPATARDWITKDGLRPISHAQRGTLVGNQGHSDTDPRSEA